MHDGSQFPYRQRVAQPDTPCGHNGLVRAAGVSLSSGTLLATPRAMGNNPAHGHAVARHADRPRGARRHRRAGDIPQRRDRFLRAACEGARAPRSRHHCRPRRHDLRRRMDHGLGRLGQRSHPWPTVQGAVYAHLGTQFRRGHREVSLLRHDPRYWPELRQQDGQGIRGEGVRYHGSRA